MKHKRSRHITRTAFVSAFTIATALIWKDVIIDVIQRFTGPGDELMVKFIIAAIATIVSIIAIRVFLHAEDEAELVIKKFAHLLEPHDIEGKQDEHHHHHHRS